MAPPRRPAHAGAVLRAVAIVSLLPFVFGYSLGFTSPALAGLTHELGLGPTARAAFSAVVNVGAMGMAAGAGQLTDQWGRRTVIAAMAAIGLLGWLLVGSATNVRALFAGRVLTGASAGGASVAVNIYVAEVAPPELRGALGAAFQVAVTVGILATYALGVGLHWRALALCGAAPCALLLLSLPWLPETPQWLLIARGDAAGARAALRRLRARDDAGLADELAALDAVAPAACAKCARESRPDDASASAPQYEPPQPGSGGAAVDAVDGDARAQPARLELAGAAPGGDGYAGAAVCEAGSAVPDTDGGEAEMALAAEATHAAVAASEGALEARATLSGIELWVLRPLLLSIVLMVFQQFSGINAVVMYSQQILTEAHFVAFAARAALLVAAAQVVVTLVSVPLMDALGRRPLLLAAAGGMCVSQATISYFFLVAGSSPALALGGLCGAVSSFSLGLGAIPWSLMGELFPQRARGLASSVATLVNWSCSFVVTLTFESLSRALGEGALFALYAGVCALTVVFVALCVPETKGRTLEDIERTFRGRG